MSRSRKLSCVAALVLGLLPGTTVIADDKGDTDGHAKPVLVDRVIVRWSAAEHGIGKKSQYVFARELAFEARLEAMAAGEAPDAPIAERFIRAALNRHIAEGLLAQLPIDPVPTPQAIASRATAAANVLYARVGGIEKVVKAMELEGISEEELAAVLRRSARASIYLDSMVAPEVEPSDADLAELQTSGATPYTKEPFNKVRDQLKRWLVSKRLNDALDSFFERSRGKVIVTWANKPNHL